MNNITSALVLSSILAATACTVTTSQDIDAGQLSGMVAGQYWTFSAGETDAYLSEGQDNFYATLYQRSFTPCGFAEPSGPHIIVSIPKIPGDYSMGFDRNMTFVDDETDTNMVAIDGRIVVDSVSADRVTGGMHGTYDFDNEVSGQFDIRVCE